MFAVRAASAVLSGAVGVVALTMAWRGLTAQSRACAPRHLRRHPLEAVAVRRSGDPCGLGAVRNRL